MDDDESQPEDDKEKYSKWYILFNNIDNTDSFKFLVAFKIIFVLAFKRSLSLCHVNSLFYFIISIIISIIGL